MRENTGRFYVVDQKTGRKFLVEPIGNPRTNFGDSLINQNQEKGSINKEESVITEENFKNIVTLKPGQSPMSYIEQLLLNT